MAGSPTSALSVLRLLTAEPAGPDLIVRRASVPGKSYSLTRSTNLTVGAGFVPLASNIPGQPGATTCTETNVAVGGRHFFYRVAVE